MLYKVFLVSAVQYSETAVHIQISPFFWISFPFRSPRSPEQGSLCSTAGSHPSSILCTRAVTQPCWILHDPTTVAHQAALSVRFPRQEYWSGLPFPSLVRIFPTQGSNKQDPCFLHLLHWQVGSLPLSCLEISIYFTHSINGVYTSIPISQFVPVLYHKFVFYIYLYLCFANRFICAIF